MVAVIMGLMSFVATNVSADSDWYNCLVNYTGVAGSTIYVNFTDVADPCAFDNQWYTVDPDHAKTLLAVILTALSTKQNVLVYVDPDQPYSNVSIIYLSQ
jgi:hypothetical protein